jgi:putative oxidoreductase
MRPLLAPLTDASYALMRVVLAFMYLSHGLQWIFGIFGQRAEVGSWPFFYAGVVEVICGPLILIGFLTPLAAFVASGEMAAAYWIAHYPRGSVFPIENGSEITVALCFGFLYIASRGGGAFSVDQLLEGREAGEVRADAG